MDPEQMRAEGEDELLAEAVEPGVGELLRVYEGVEARYFAAAAASPPAYESRTSYATHT